VVCSRHTLAATHAVEQLEADAIGQAVTELVTASGAGQAAIDAVSKAVSKLLTDVAAAQSVDGITAARADFIKSITGTGPLGTGGIADIILGTSGGVLATLNGVINKTTELRAQLDAELTAALEGLKTVNACTSGAPPANLDAVVDAIIKAMAKFTASVNALAPQLTGATAAQAKSVTGALALAQAMFHTP
jgi:hypothetical protein